MNYFLILNFWIFKSWKVEQTYMLDLKTAEQLFYILYQGRSLPPSKAKHSTDYNWLLWTPLSTSSWNGTWNKFNGVSIRIFWIKGSPSIKTVSSRNELKPLIVMRKCHEPENHSFDKIESVPVHYLSDFSLDYNSYDIVHII